LSEGEWEDWVKVNKEIDQPNKTGKDDQLQRSSKEDELAALLPRAMPAW
jgi:hypothetical protein